MPLTLSNLCYAMSASRCLPLPHCPSGLFLFKQPVLCKVSLPLPPFTAPLPCSSLTAAAPNSFNFNLFPWLACAVRLVRLCKHLHMLLCLISIVKILFIARQAVIIYRVFAWQELAAFSCSVCSTVGAVLTPHTHTQTHMGRPHRDVAVMAHLLPLPLLLLCLLDPSGYASAHSWTCLFSAALSGLCFSVLFCFSVSFISSIISLICFLSSLYLLYASTSSSSPSLNSVLFCSMLSGHCGAC